MVYQFLPTTFTTPDWVKNAVFYQIFPERFANGDPTNDPENVCPWGTFPTPKNYMGGDLRGIIDRLDYLTNLGITAIYLNPIFHAASNHGYNTYNYYAIDPRLGDLATFHELIRRAHRSGIHVVLDGVFNHCGRGFFAFQDILENGADSPYFKWFHITDLPLQAYDKDKPANYVCWWNIPSLPKFNTDHKPTRRYLLNVARYWIEQGADGWRLDVPNEIADHEFWREFRHVVKSVNPNAYIVGEIWKDGSAWLDSTQFDAVMNYLFRDLCRDFFAYEKINVDEFARGIDSLLQRYAWEITLAQLNLFGSHDTPRFRTEAGGNSKKLFPAILFQMTFPGAPCIYYGDEIGMMGGAEPRSRGCFPWNRSIWDMPLREWVQRCIALRHAHPALRTGTFQSLATSVASRTYAFARWNDHERLVIAINASEHADTLNLPLKDVPIPDNAALRDVLSDRVYTVEGRQIAQVYVPARSGVVMV